MGKGETPTTKLQSFKIYLWQIAPQKTTIVKLFGLED